MDASRTHITDYHPSILISPDLNFISKVIWAVCPVSTVTGLCSYTHIFLLNWYSWAWSVLFVWKRAITISRMLAKSVMSAEIPVCTVMSVVSCSLFPLHTFHGLLKFLVFTDTKICFWVIRGRRGQYCTSSLYSPVWFRIAIWLFLNAVGFAPYFFVSYVPQFSHLF